jgi:hypothetical protein
MEKLIYSKMAAATKIFGQRGISKDDRNSYQKFDYRTIDSTLAAANAVFSELGLFLTLHCEGGTIERRLLAKAPETSETTTLVGEISEGEYAGSQCTKVITETSKGERRIDYSLTGLWTLRIYAEDGSYVECTGLPAGSTSQDDSKLYGQVSSYVLKETLFKMFLIPTTGQDLDGMDETRNQPPTQLRTVTPKLSLKQDSQPKAAVTPSPKQTSEPDDDVSPAPQTDSVPDDDVSPEHDDDWGDW